MKRKSTPTRYAIGIEQDGKTGSYGAFAPDLPVPELTTTVNCVEIAW